MTGPTRATLAQELSRLVVEALVQIGLTEKDVLGGAILHTDLPWQVPPLILEDTLFTLPLANYFERPIYVNVDNLINLFTDSLADMRNAPRKVLTYEGYRHTSLALPAVRGSERHLHFSIPDGFPSGISDYAGVTLALECAHVLRHNTRLEDFVSDDDNYYAVLPSGIDIGVRDGLPTMYAEQWDLSAAGMVQELLTQPRGALWEGCDHNVIAKVRSVVHQCRVDLRDFAALDWVMQALRVIDGERELLQAVRSIKAVAYERGARMQLLQEAVELAHRTAITDRQRIDALRNMLVPEIMSAADFTKQLYSFYAAVPPVVVPKVLMRIQQGVQDLLEREEMLYARINPTKQPSKGQ